AGNPLMEVTVLGKVRTVALMIGIPTLLLAEAPFIAQPETWHTAAIIILLMGAIGHVLASVDYLVRGIRNAIAMRRAQLDPKLKSDRDAFLKIGETHPKQV